MRSTVIFGVAGAAWFAVVAAAWVLIDDKYPAYDLILRAAYFVLAPTFLACCAVWLVRKAHIGVHWTVGAVVCVGACVGLAWLRDLIDGAGSFGYMGYAWVIYGLPVVALAVFAGSINYVHRMYR